MLNRLQKLGLSANEAKAYMILFKKDMLTAQDIAKASKIPPTKIYQVLERMCDKNIIEKVQKGERKKTTYYSAVNPYALTEKWLKEKQEALMEASETTKKLIEMHTASPKKQKTWTMDYAQRINKFKEITKSAKNEVILVDKEFGHFHLYYDLIRRKVPVTLFTTESNKEKAEKAMPNAKIIPTGDHYFDKYATFAMIDKEHLFIFPRKEDFGVYTKDSRIVNFFMKAASYLRQTRSFELGHECRQFDSFEEYAKFMADYESIFVKQNPGAEIVSFAKHIWYPLLDMKGEHEHNKMINKGNVNVFAVCEGDTEMDQISADFYKRDGFNVKTGLKNNYGFTNMFIYGHRLLLIFYGTELSCLISELVHSKEKLGSVTSQFIKRLKTIPAKITVVEVENQSLARNYTALIKSQFD